MSIVRDIINIVSEAQITATSSSNVCSMDCSIGANFVHVLAENTAINVINIPTMDYFAITLKIIQDAAGSGYTFDWKAGSLFSGGSAPTLTNTANAVDVFILTTTDGGTVWEVYTAGTEMAVSV